MNASLVSGSHVSSSRVSASNVKSATATAKGAVVKGASTKETRLSRDTRRYSKDTQGKEKKRKGAKKSWWKRFLGLFKQKTRKTKAPLSRDGFEPRVPSSYKPKEELRSLRRSTYSTISLPSSGRGSVSRRVGLDGFHSDVESLSVD